MKRTKKELDEFKIAHTRFDRRVKLTPEDREYLVKIFNQRKALNLSTRDIAEIFGIYPGNVYRYANYNHYLEQQRGYSSNYLKSLGDRKRRRKQRDATRDTLRYKDNLLTIIEEAV